MKKIIAITLILLLIAGLASGCQKTTDVQSDIIYPRIVVIKESSESDNYYKFQPYLGEYTNLQDALDEIVDRYNKSNNDEDLFVICHVIFNRPYFKNSDELVIIYYSKFFDEIWSNNDFNNRTIKTQGTFAYVLLDAMYKSDMKMESIEFFKKYVVTIKNADEKVDFSRDYFTNYRNDRNLNYDAVAAMLEYTKDLEKNYYNVVDEMNKATICSMIAQYSEMINDTKTAKEYSERARQIFQKMEDQASHKYN
ncbi:MAG: hypothetical protein AAGU14_04325 [Eubacteriaceae bacterium]